MTAEGGKERRVVAPSSPFARLKPIAPATADAASALDLLGRALSDFPSSLRLDVRLVAGGDDAATERWDVPAGAKRPRVQQRTSQNADVVLLIRPETLLEILRGALAPYDALYSGRLRVGGDLEAAKALTRHLSDPSVPYVAPC
jgi:hypothetical protein